MLALSVLIGSRGCRAGVALVVVRFMLSEALKLGLRRNHGIRRNRHGSGCHLLLSRESHLNDLALLSLGNLVLISLDCLHDYGLVLHGFLDLALVDLGLDADGVLEVI